MKNIFFPFLATILLIGGCASLGMDNKTTTSKQEPTSQNNAIASELESAKRLYGVSLLYYKENGEAKYKEFETQVTPIWKKYNIKVEKVIKPVVRGGSLLGENIPVEQPDEMQIISIDPALFSQYIEDPDYQAIKGLREEALHQETFVMGSLSEHFAPVSETNKGMWTVSFIDFKPDGEAKHNEYETRVQPVYDRYGIHDQYTLKVDRTGAAVGAEDTTLGLTDEVQIGYVEDPSVLPQYLQDQAYQEVRPLRVDAADSLYVFFMGMESENQ